MLAEAPLLGVGPDGYAPALFRLTTPAERAACFPPLNLEPDPHDTFAGWAARTGVVGLASVLAVLWAIGRRLWNRPGALATIGRVVLAGLLVDALVVDLLLIKFPWAFAGFVLAVSTSDEA